MPTMFSIFCFIIYFCIYFLFCLNNVQGFLWKGGVVHYAINSKDYDVHSQDIIVSTLSQIQDSVCVKFFQTTQDLNSTGLDRILYITNPDKRKTCSPNLYDFTKTVVDLPIGYKCLNQRDITRIVTEMLQASIDSSGTAINSYDLIDKFEEKDQIKSSLIPTRVRNFINSHYKSECGIITSQSVPTLRRRNNIDNLDASQPSAANINYYKDKLWPLGIVFYGVAEKLANTPDFKALQHAMTTIELSTCVVFQEVVLDDVLLPKSYIWFDEVGDDMPRFGCVEGKQSLKLSSMITGAPGHLGHTVNNLLRILAVPMMSNRYDRDNYVVINWSNVEMGKEQYLERDTEDAWITQLPYDFESVTHASANYMCKNCTLGEATVQPVQDKLWQRTLSMGHTKELSEWDIKLVKILYSNQCIATQKK